MGPHGSGVRVARNNGQRLLEFAKSNSLLVVGIERAADTLATVTQGTAIE